MDSTSLIVALVIALAVIFILASSIRVIRQQRVGMVERLGRFNRTLEPGPHLLIPVLDKVRYNLDMRENVIPFPPQGVITEDNLMVGIDSVIYFQIIDPVRACASPAPPVSSAGIHGSHASPARPPVEAQRSRLTMATTPTATMSTR